MGPEGVPFSAGHQVSYGAALTPVAAEGLWELCNVEIFVPRSRSDARGWKVLSDVDRVEVRWWQRVPT